jgi:hypothetical protein
MHCRQWAMIATSAWGITLEWEIHNFSFVLAENLEKSDEMSIKCF